MATRRQLKATIIQLIQYSITGGAFFWSGYLVFFLCDKGLGLDLWWSKLFANIVGVTVNFLLERYWVFAGDKNKHKKQPYKEAPARFILLTLVNFVIDYGIILGLKTVGVTPYIGQFISAGFFWGWNYLWYRYWVFARPARKAAAAKRRSAKGGR
jgi:putative flippase GtrA